MEDSKPHLERVPLSDSALWKNKQPLLNSLDAELTERCNNNCVHCYINVAAEDAPAKSKELSTGEWKELLTQAVALGCITVRFTGGEPLLREDFEELYLFARRQGLRVILFTNATRLTPRLAKVLSAVPPLEKVEVTLYGMKPESYERTSRLPGSFQAAWQGIGLLKEHQIPFGIKSVMLPPNRAEVDPLKRWASVNVPGMEHDPAWTILFDLRARRDSAAKNGLIRTLRPSAAECLEVFARGADYRAEMQQFCRRLLAPQAESLFACGAGAGQGCIDAYGFFQPCLQLRHPGAVVNLRNMSLEKALTSFMPQLRALKSENPIYLERCSRCFLKGLCEQCPAKSWMEHGTLDTPVDYLCEVAHAQARFLGLLTPGEAAWQVVDWQERINRMPRVAEATQP
jgi:radical SAM protein with 4Fe4S-binding SPASM domain